ncbi:MAG: hypothetical protein WCC03_22430 [Candidatus Acidiferrales bacterium]
MLNRDTQGTAMIPEEVKPPDAEPAKSEQTQPEDLPKEDPDKVRGEVFKRMFPDIPRKDS